MMREAGPGDVQALDAFLLRHVEGAMFPLANLRNHGLGEGDFASTHSHALRVWMAGDEPTGLLALTRGGMLLPMLPDGGDPGPFAPALIGLDITGAVGPAGQVRTVLSALGLAGRPTLKDADEPGFRLDLAELRVPAPNDSSLVRAAAEHRPILVEWRADYHREVLRTPEQQVARRAAAEIDDGMSNDRFRVLLLAGEPVAMTGFNAVLPEIVQIGGVYTPPGLRRRGYARLAVALHLADVRARGVRRAVLFAASEMAAQVYRGIGFRQSGSVALVLFDGSQRVQP
jgi:GNAT superfamily N-acetyltransferase